MQTTTKDKTQEIDYKTIELARTVELREYNVALAKYKEEKEQRKRLELRRHGLREWRPKITLNCK